ncbi:hypothetical protein CU004_2706 [Enterococcus faecium]|nr:hypothetical protein [Enterococcus faecium]
MVMAIAFKYLFQFTKTVMSFSVKYFLFFSKPKKFTIKKLSK